MSASYPTFDGMITEVLERYGNRYGTEAQCDNAQSLLNTAIALLSPEAHTKFFSDSNLPPEAQSAEGLAADLEAYGDTEGMEAQMDETQQNLTSALNLLTQSEAATFYAESEVVDLIRDHGADDAI